VPSDLNKLFFKKLEFGKEGKYFLFHSHILGLNFKVFISSRFSRTHVFTAMIVDLAIM
jgi:hypothetical protein